jgi:hypothetical protein
VGKPGLGEDGSRLHRRGSVLPCAWKEAVMAENRSLREALDAGGAFEVWRLLTEDEQRQAAAALWSNADTKSRQPLELALAKTLKFRPKMVRHLSAEKVAGRLVRLIKDLPEPVAFQYLFHLHMSERRELMGKFLDAVGLPHEDGVLDLEEDASAPAEDAVATAGRGLLKEHGHEALVYLGTLWVADKEFWAGLGELLDGYDDNGDELAGGSS